jgi:hypothetical protein
MRTTDVNPDTEPAHKRVEDAVGEDIFNEKGLPNIGELDASFSVTRKVDVVAEGEVKKKVKVKPASAVPRAERPDEPELSKGVAKSADND